MVKKLTIENVKQYLEEYGYTLLDEKYINSKTKMQLLCAGENETKEKHPCRIAYNRFQQGTRCKFCAPYKLKQTLLEKYGVDNIFKSEDFKEKLKKSNLKKYGVEYASQSDQIKEKVKQTNLKKYGVEHSFQNEDVKEKIKKKNLELYGAENPLQSEQIRKKIKETNLKKYGETAPLKNKNILEKAQATNLERYGSKFTMQNELVKEKAKKTNLERYGYESSLLNNDVKEKIKQTNLKLFGCENVFANEDIKNKIKETNLEKYGVEYSSQCEEVKEKVRQTNLKKYGVEYAIQNPEILSKILKSSYSSKTYTFPSGRQEDILGYENYCLDDLLNKENIREDDICVGFSNIPIIHYKLNEKDKVYFSDIYVKPNDNIIEVKSTHTFTCDLKKNEAKWNAAFSSTHNFEIRIYKKNKLFIKLQRNEYEFFKNIKDKYVFTYKDIIKIIEKLSKKLNLNGTEIVSILANN